MMLTIIALRTDRTERRIEKFWSGVGITINIDIETWVFFKGPPVIDRYRSKKEIIHKVYFLQTRETPI